MFLAQTVLTLKLIILFQTQNVLRRTNHNQVLVNFLKRVEQTANFFQVEIEIHSGDL